MSVRLDEYTALIKELLGPRKGSEEMMVNDPRSEYVTGILEPKDYNRLGEDFGNSDLGAYEPEVEGDEDDIDRSNDFEIHPSIFDPRALPKSLGLSFVVKSNETPLVDICFTWARYIKEGNHWKRRPENFILYDADITKRDVKRPVLGIRIVLDSIKLEENMWHVSVYFVNETKFTNYVSTGDLIFQPQIRVRFHENVSAIAVDRRRHSGHEEGQLELLYRNLYGLARGHMCGATWKDIDPERPSEAFKENPLIPDDIKRLSPAEQTKFVNPDVRTEYLPAYSVNQSTVLVEDIPTMAEKDTSAEILAEKFNADDIVAPLEKISKQYRIWIDSQKQISASLHESQREIAAENLNRCDESCKRIDEGIKLLRDREDVRLAFCFMNKVMDVQARWSRKKSLIWRPFQIGFILQCIPSIEDRNHNDRKLCDLLWYPTGGGKTEAYLGLVIFTLALRRLRGTIEGISPYGTAILSRYTLRLLTVQQFRRALAAITAAEYLRTTKWKPASLAGKKEPSWGDAQFSIGLWLGGDVTPNILIDHPGWDIRRNMATRYVGALSILKYTHTRSARPGERVSHSGEPAQVLKCPCCAAVTSVPSAGYFGTQHEIYWIVAGPQKPNPRLDELDYRNFTVTDLEVLSLPPTGYYCVHLTFTSSVNRIDDGSINEWWRQKIKDVLKCELCCSAPSRPGYFIVTAQNVYRTPVDFEIHCPNPSCNLNNVEWSELIPGTGEPPSYRQPVKPFTNPKKENFSFSIPIPAYTTDAQVYARCPSVVIATVDKFARLPFEPRAAALFGNVNTFDSMWGYYRHVALPDRGRLRARGNIVPVPPFFPPELIIQDELHLIEGPLGSMVGIYETAIDYLARRILNGKEVIPKYIASTATTRQASTQIASLYDRKLRQFPQSGIDALDNFFANAKEGHPLDDQEPGRLYVGVCAPGKGPQTPTVRIWSILMQQAERIRRRIGDITGELDYFWTVVGYFNAIRELAAARSLYRQDIPEWIRHIDGVADARIIEDYNLVELNSNIDSARIPAVLEQLEKSGAGVDAVMATSMFGTGVDIDRLSLMIVHGQPKTTASYIQSTGRVGRKKGALVVTFLRSTRPRDLDHYEFFTGYHRALHRYVEPVTVAPFSPRACDRALGPVTVGILRNGNSVSSTRIHPDWAPESEQWRNAQGISGSRRMNGNRNASELDAIISIMENRSQNQPGIRKRTGGIITRQLDSDLDLWENISRIEPSLFYFESAFNYQPNNPVVLGDEQHRQSNRRMVFEKTPQSMRDVESTTRFSG